MLDGMLQGRIIAPELQGITAWFNSKPLTIAGLRGRVVLLDFWAYTCVNCIRTLPALKRLHDEYSGRGLVVIGVHSPEFAFEREAANVKEAVRDAGIRYPVALDADMRTWNAYDNRYWPAQYLIDKDGYIAYVNFGEGSHSETEEAVCRQLGIKKGIGKKIAKEKQPAYLFDQSPETYAGFSRNPGLGSGLACDAKGCSTYIDPDEHAMNTIYPHGRWVQESGFLELQEAPGRLAYRFNAREANMVLAPVKGSVEAWVFIDGKRTAALEIDRPKLYNVFTDKNGKYGERELAVVFQGPVRVYAYTFG